MGRRKKSSSRSQSEAESRKNSVTVPEDSEDCFLVLTPEQAQYIRKHPTIFTEIFQDNTPGFNIIHLICKEGNADLLCDMIQLMNSSLNSPVLEAQDFESQYTALHDAVSYGNINCAVKLLQYGASLATPAMDGFTPLDIAVWNQFKNGFVPESKNLNVLTWGPNCNYNLGHGHDRSLKLPEKVKLFNRDRFKSSICNVNFGKYHTLFLDKSGNVYACGYGKGGRLGLGSEQTYLEPTKIPDLKNIVKISCSNDHSLALSGDGKVYSWGVNTHRVLGHPEAKHVLKPHLIKASFTFSKIVTVKAAKYHSILVAADQIYTFGFNGGQLGHLDMGEEYQVVPRTVTRLRHKPGDNLGKIAHVHGSAAATVVGFENGSIFICNQYDIKKVASLNRFDHSNALNFNVGNQGQGSYLSVRTRKIRVTGGSLARQAASENTNKNTKPLLITILDTNGLVFCCIPSMFKNVLLYHWDVYTEKFLVTDIALGSYSLQLVTTNGEVYSCDPYPTLKSEKEIKRDHSLKVWSAGTTRKKETVQMLRPIKLLKQSGLHNGTKIVSNGTGLVRACIVQDRISTLDFLPSVEPSTFTSDIAALFDNDAIYETDLTVHCQSGKEISAHKAIIANASEKLRKTVASAAEQEQSYIGVDGAEETVTAMLETIYMLHTLPPTKCPQLYNGMVDVTRCDGIDRDFIIELSDVVLVSEEGSKFQCHQCVLAARVEYFRTHFMVNSRWGATSLNQEIPIDADKRTLSDFVYYVYTDKFPRNFSLESLKMLLTLSDQYLVSRLKSFCEVSLVSFITEENLIHMLRTANDYNAETLRAVCLHIVAMNVPYYLEHRLLETLEEEILVQLDKVYKEVVLFHLRRTRNKDYSVLEYLENLVHVTHSRDVSVPVVESETKSKVFIRGLPDMLDEYISENEETVADSLLEPPPVSPVPLPVSPVPLPVSPVPLPVSPVPLSVSPVPLSPCVTVSPTRTAASSSQSNGTERAAKDVEQKPVSPEPSPTKLSPVTKPSPTKPSWGAANNVPSKLNRSLSEIIEEEELQRKLSLKNKDAQRMQGKQWTGKSPVKGRVARQNSEENGMSTRSPAAPWGVVPSTQPVSLKEIMTSEDKKQPVKRKPQGTSPQLDSRAPSTADHRSKSETFDFNPDRQVHSLRAIMEAEQASSHSVVPKSFSRPLEVIQIEERAIQELSERYKVDGNCNEFIAIRTVSEKTVSKPMWGKNSHLNF